MTILQTVAIRDNKVAFNRPFFTPTTGAAIRAFSDEVNRSDANNEMNRHPADFSLYSLGTYDDQTAVFQQHAQPQLLIEAVQCLTPVNNPSALQQPFSG